MHGRDSRNFSCWKPQYHQVSKYKLSINYCYKQGIIFNVFNVSIGTLSKDVLEPRTSTGSEAFSLFICLDTNKLVLLSFFSLLKTIYPRVSTKSFPSDAKSPLPVDVRSSKTLLLKLPNKIRQKPLKRTRNVVAVTWKLAKAKKH